MNVQASSVKKNIYNKKIISIRFRLRIDEVQVSNFVLCAGSKTPCYITQLNPATLINFFSLAFKDAH